MGTMDLKISMAAARVNANLTQKEFAELCGVRVETVNSWEQGKTEPPVGAIRKLSEKSNIPMDFIFCGKS
jgi:transcriptional regulator with XRE-family HTH domain